MKKELRTKHVGFRTRPSDLKKVRRYLNQGKMDMTPSEYMKKKWDNLIKFIDNFKQ